MEQILAAGGPDYCCSRQGPRQTSGHNREVREGSAGDSRSDVILSGDQDSAPDLPSACEFNNSAAYGSFQALRRLAEYSTVRRSNLEYVQHPLPHLPFDFEYVHIFYNQVSQHSLREPVSRVLLMKLLDSGYKDIL